MDPDAGFDARLRAGGVAFDDRDAELLGAVDEEGSLNAAVKTLGRSYSRSHERLSELESAFGSLVERRRGGAGGGGSELTDEARDLLSRLERLQSGLSGIAAAEETVVSGTVLERDGELATVDTRVGRVRALVPTGATDVELTIREDAVTLNDPADAPPAGATSARNRFEGTVRDLRRGRSVARVWVGVDPDTTFVALVTGESLDRLGLSNGDPVVASFKAAATRGVPSEP